MDAPSLAQLRELVAHAWFTIGYPPVGSLVLVEVNHRARRASPPGSTSHPRRLRARR